MSRVAVSCAHCGASVLKEARDINRATKVGLSLYCDRTCAGLAHRNGKSKTQIVAEKAAYDQQYRALNKDILARKKADRHKRTYDPVAQAAYNKSRMAHHVEYCRRPEYREYKRQYDRTYRAEHEYGEYAECFLLMMDIREECLSQQSDYEIRMSKGGIAKSQQRRRDYERANRQNPEIGPLGNLELGERR